MNIAAYVANFPPVNCGIGDYTFHLIYTLREVYNVNVIVYTNTDNKNKYPYQKQISINTLRSFLDFVKILKQEKVDVLIIQYQSHSFLRKSIPNLLVIWLRLFTKIKTILVMHDFAGPVLFKKIPSRLSGRVINYLTCLFVNSLVVTDILRLEKFLKYDYMNMFRRKTSHIVVGSNIARVSSNSTFDERKDICFFGLIHPDKNINKLINAFANVVSSDNYHGLKLYIIGVATDQKYEMELKNLAISKGCKDKVVFTGYLNSNEVSLLLQRMKLCILPYQHGVSFSTSSTVGACINHDLPVVATALDISRKFPGMINIDYPVREDQISMAIKDVLDDHLLYDKLLREIAVVKDDRSWETISEQYMKILFAVDQKEEIKDGDTA
jgi:glycosyltransferase involved in cell wall biosynthesis